MSDFFFCNAVNLLPAHDRCSAVERPVELRDPKEDVSANVPTIAKTVGKRTAEQARLFLKYGSGAEQKQPQRQDHTGRVQTGRDRTGRCQTRDRTGRQQARTGRRQDQTSRRQVRSRAIGIAKNHIESEQPNPLSVESTALKLFTRRWKLCPRKGKDDELRNFPDNPEPMPPISCLLRGCENHWLNSREEFMQHCDELHGGYQTYRLRVLHLLSRTVYQFPGSLQRAAMQNLAEFQCRSQTAWQHFTPEMKELMQGESPDTEVSSHSGDGQQDATTDPLGRSGRWTSRRWVPCVVCAMQSWQEDLRQEYIAGKNCCFPNPEAAQALLHWKSYAQVWTSVPKEELRASAVQLRWYPEKLMWEAYSEPLLLHKRRITNAMKEGSARANLCHDCYKSLTKQTPEMPTCALANGRWLGRHPEIMRSMPCGHRLLLPVRRVILTRVIFTNDVKNPWGRSHSQKGLDGVTVVVQQASAVERVLEYPPKDLGGNIPSCFRWP